MTAAPAVRTAGAGDVPALLALVHSAYRGEASRQGWTTEADLLDGTRTTAELLAADLGAPAVIVLVAEDPEEVGAREIVGCAAVTLAGETASFGTFAVRPPGQRRGTGSALLAAAEAHARSAGAVRMEMSVIAQRGELIAWYRRRGYTPTGQIRPFPYGDERFGRPRRPDLEFVVLVKPLTPASASPTP